jgi:hypothetical protein
MIGQEAMRLVASVILRPQSPVDVWESGVVFIVYCAKDTAAYLWSLLSMNARVVKEGVYQLLVQI